MNFRLFTGSGTAAVETAVNEWLARQVPAPSVHLSETRFHQTTTLSGIRLTTVTVSLWYEPQPAKAAKAARKKRA